MFSFKDDDEQWLSLRYDLTAPLARYVAENFDKLPKPYRSYRAGYVFRNEKPGPGRFRQFMQFDADTVGAGSVAADAEICMMAADTLEALGVKRGDYVIKVNNRKVLDGVLDSIGLGGEENAGRRLTVLRAIDKFDKFGAEGVRLLLGAGRKDESGDFTKGAGLNGEQIEGVLKMMASPSEVESIAAAQIPEGEIKDYIVFNRWADGQVFYAKPDHRRTLKALRATFGGNAICAQGIDELEAIIDLTKAAGFGEGQIMVDPSVVRGLEYYTGPVFEAELTFEVQGEDGKSIRFGSVGGGGRYDGLVGRFRGENVPATGFSIGVSRLFAALKAIHSPIVTSEATHGPVIVLVLDQPEIARYQSFVSKLRTAGIRSELYLGSSGMNAQLKYADKRGSICAVIQGSSEREKSEVSIRDLVLGAELAASTKDRADYLELRAKAQFTVAEDRLVEAVQEVLARHK